MSLIIKTQYITADDFKIYFNIDLEEELKKVGNPSGASSAFIKRLEDRMAAYLDAYYYQKVDDLYPTFSDYQKHCYSMALLEQAIYIFKGGDIAVNSGYDYERGMIASNDEITYKSLAPLAKMYLLNCGLLTRKIRNLRR